MWRQPDYHECEGGGISSIFESLISAAQEGQVSQRRLRFTYAGDSYRVILLPAWPKRSEQKLRLPFMSRVCICEAPCRCTWIPNLS